MRFLLSWRWLGFLLVVALLALLAWRLGVWQFHRLDERRAENRTILTNLRAAPLPVADVMGRGTALPERHEWRRVTATGTWDDRRTVVVKYQTRQGGPGVDVVTPLVTRDGTAVVVDRGWLATDNNGRERPRLPRATTGQVTVTGYTRVDATGGAAVVHDLATRAVSAAEVGKVVPYEVYGGFVMMTSQAPEPAKALGAPQLPEIDDGPHFFYGVQWWFFAALALGGFVFLAWDEVRRRRVESTSPEGGDEQAQTGAGSSATASSRNWVR